MIGLPDISRLKFIISKKPRRGRLNSAINPKYYKKILKPINNISFINPISYNYINNNSYEGNKNKHNNYHSSSVFISGKEKNIINKNLKQQIKYINNSKEKTKTEREIIPNISEFNTKHKNKNSPLTFRATYNNIKKIFSNKPVDINKFINEINSFLLPNNKTFENLQNLLNYKIKNKESSKKGLFIQFFKRNDLPINKINYGVYYKYIIKNTFKEVLKKAMLNKVLISKQEIKEEYKRQINGIKQYLNLYNKENKGNKDLINGQNLKSLIINNSCTALIPRLNENKIDTIKLETNKSIKKLNLEKHKRNRKIIQNNSTDNIFFHLDYFKKDSFDTKNHNVNSKNKELTKNKNSLLSLPDNSNKFNKENFEYNFQRDIFKTKIESLKEKRLKNIIQKQKNIISDYIKIKEKNKHTHEDYSIKTENSVQDNYVGFNFFTNRKNWHNNKNEDIINCINNSEKSIKFENPLIKDKISKYLFKENNKKESEFKINSVNGFENKTLFNNNLNSENEIKNNNLNLKALSKNNVSFLKNSLPQVSLLNESNQQNKQIVKENYSQLFDGVIKPIKKEEEKKRDNPSKLHLNKKFFLKKKKTLNVRSFKDFLNEEYYESQVKAVNNKIEEKKNCENVSDDEGLKMKQNSNNEEQKLLEENWQYQFNNFKNYIQKLKNMSKDEFIKDTLRFIKNSD